LLLFIAKPNEHAPAVSPMGYITFNNVKKIKNAYQATILMVLLREGKGYRK